MDVVTSNVRFLQNRKTDVSTVMESWFQIQTGLLRNANGMHGEQETDMGIHTS
jgi:hypothetical protein